MKYRFEIIYATKEMVRASELMRGLDLDIGAIGIKDVFTFTSDKNPSIQTIKDELNKTFKSCDMTLFHIEGGMVE